MSTLTPETIAVKDLSDPRVIADPYPFYAALRPRSPIFGYSDLPPGTVPGADEAPSSWAVLSHDQVVEVSKQPDIYSSRDPLQEASGAPTLMLVNHDDPEHRALRNRVQKFFTTSAVTPQADWLADVCDDLVKDIAGRPTDIMQGIAADLPAMMMTRALDMPLEDFPKFRSWATAFMLSAPLTPEERSASNDEMLAYFVAKVSARAEEVANGSESSDFVSSLLRDEPGQRGLSVEEVIRFCFTLVVAGAETTTGLIGNLFWIAATQPSAYSALRADPSLMDAFIEETLRIAGPPQRLFRIATQDTQLGEQKIRKGDWVAVFFAAANHDPGVWDSPTEFRLDRPTPRSHFSFGHGIHQCLGAMLVRLEARAVLGALVKYGASVDAIDGGFTRQTATQLSYALDRCEVVVRGS